MYKISKVVGLLVFFVNTCAIAADSLPDPLRDVVLKHAVMDSLNKKYADIPRQFLPDSMPFSRLGLNGMQTGARQEFMQYVNAGKSSAGINRMQTMFNGLHDSTKVSRFIDNKLRGFYALKPQSSMTLPGLPENKLRGISWQTTYSDTTAMLSGWWNEGVIQDQLTVGSIPVQLNYSTLSGYDESLKGAHFLKLSFDRQAYLDKVNKQLQQAYNLNKYFLDDIDIKNSIKSYATAQLSSMDSMKNKLSADQLIYLDSAQLHNALQNTSAEYSNKVMALKQQLGGVKEMNQLLGSQKEAQQHIESVLHNPENTSRVASNLLHMSSLQRLMINMKEFKVGSIGANASKGTLSDLFMTGATGSFLKSNKFVMMALGKSNEMGIQDVGLKSATGNSSYGMQFVRIGRGDIGNKQTHFSALNANAKPQNNNGFNTAAISRNVFVGSVSQQCSLGSLGKIDVELSKSASQFGNSAAATVSKSAASHFMDDIWATASIGLAYTGDVKKWGITQKVYMNYSGLGYVNPGSPFGSRGTLQYGFLVKRSWLKNRAVVSLRTDMRNLAVSPLTDEKRKSIQFSADGRYRFTRKLTLSMNMLQNSLRENGTTAFLNRKLSFMSQANGKIGGLAFSNNSTLGIQQLNYQSIHSLFINMGSMHTFMAGPGMVIVNAFYNRDVKDAAIYNNLLNVDGGYQYTLWKLLSCGSSLIFMDSKDVVRQIGLRQQISAQFFKRWSLALSADGRKNLKNTAANFYYGRFNTAMSLHYQIN
jgi:hypothetical protein